MADYAFLGATPPIAAAADTTGLNTGNLTTLLDQTSIGDLKVGQAEIFHMVVEGVQLGASANIRWNQTRHFGFVFPFNGSEWWGTLPMRPGDQLQFLWTLAASATPVPILTAWWRYDINLPANRGF